MRIAISGTHYSGKTTLIAALLKQLPGYTALAEPYRLLEEEGYVFSDPPSLEDFEEQFAYSIELIRQSGPNTLFDRSPFDFLVYADWRTGLNFTTHQLSNLFHQKALVLQLILEVVSV